MLRGIKDCSRMIPPDLTPSPRVNGVPKPGQQLEGCRVGLAIPGCHMGDDRAVVSKRFGNLDAPFVVALVKPQNLLSDEEDGRGGAC
jgi:hypothetical protein